MTQKEFRDSHKNLNFKTFHICEKNALPSATDPTQDIPVSRIQLSANGEPLNVRQFAGALINSGLKTEQLSSIDRRNNDKFDVARELQASEQKVRDYKPLKVTQNEN